MKLVYLMLAGVLAAGMAVVQHYALLYYWYWTYPWLDTVMHFSGGVVITLIAAAYVGVTIRAVLITLVIGVLWEAYEFAIGLSSAEPKFVGDTVTDLAMDIVGALGAYGMMRGWETLRSRSREARDASPDQTSS